MEELARKIALTLEKPQRNYDWGALILRWGNGIRAEGGTPDPAQMRALTICLANAMRSGPMTEKAAFSCLMIFSKSLGETYSSLYQALRERSARL
jgi:hypothetical protein